jgi:hypothetical protein
MDRINALTRCPHPTFPRARGKGINKIKTRNQFDGQAGASV